MCPLKENVKIKTVTEVFKFKDPDARVYELGRRGTPIKKILELFGVRFLEHKKVLGNIFLTEGIEYIWKAVTGVTGLVPFDSANAHIGVGDGTDPESPDQTGLTGTNKYYKLVDSGYPQVSGNKVIFRATFGPDEANFAWNEWTVANGPDDTYVNLNRKQESLGTKAAGSTWILTVELSIS